jgi:hypothetical protein
VGRKGGRGGRVEMSFVAGRVAAHFALGEKRERVGNENKEGETEEGKQ